MHSRWIPLMLLLLVPPALAQDEEFSFDAEAFEPKDFELSGYLEAELEYARANRDGALYQLAFFGLDPDTEINRFTSTLELDARLRKGWASLNVKTHSQVVWDYLGETEQSDLFEGYLSLQPGPEFALDIGKKAMRWGKGYAWNPVAFVERAKDAGDPDLSREGYWVATADLIARFDGPLQTLAFTPLILPVREELNEDFGAVGHTHFGAKLYLLYRDVDIDLMFLSSGSRGAQLGMDFSWNLAPHFEVHGEVAYYNDVVHPTVTGDCRAGRPREEDEVSYLLGTRYRTEEDITLLLEYYVNGRGNAADDQERFYRCVQQAWESGDPSLIERLPLGEDLDRGPFSRPNPMREYLAFRAWWEEPGNLLYLTAGLQTLVNLEDHSFSVAPEVIYEGVDDLQLMLRASLPFGGANTEWGEKPNTYKVELQARYYF
jgi:hypothetical protein